MSILQELISINEARAKKPKAPEPKKLMTPDYDKHYRDMSEFRKDAAESGFSVSGFSYGSAAAYNEDGEEVGVFLSKHDVGNGGTGGGWFHPPKKKQKHSTDEAKAAGPMNWYEILDEVGSRCGRVKAPDSYAAIAKYDKMTKNCHGCPTSNGARKMTASEVENARNDGREGFEDVK